VTTQPDLRRHANRSWLFRLVGGQRLDYRVISAAIGVAATFLLAPLIATAAVPIGALFYK
jgi:hypothetical protein